MSRGGETRVQTSRKNNLHQLVREISSLLNQVTGIELGPRQAHMVEARLTRRMSDLGMSDPAAYHEYVREHLREELPALTSLLTTHHTFFFREFFHFEFLEQKALPALVENMRREGRTTLKVWSAACSRGQEVYSLSMCLYHWFRRFAPDLAFEILGSDVDAESIAYAKNGVYRWDEVKEIPLAYMASNWARGTGEISAYVKARQPIKSQCRFREINLFDAGRVLAGQSFDLIFCRNVFIYFSQEQIRVVTDSMLKLLNDGGYLFLGISESLNGLRIPVNHLGQSVYEKPRAKVTPVASAFRDPIRPAPVAARPVRVLCVDDSPAILTLLKRILSPENGFEVVDTAGNGLEAAEKLKRNKVDLMTLDIHMPEQDGVEYLRRNLGPDHPPVVMVSSVNRENADLALQALELGAKDYVEKPTLGDLSFRAEEIRAKLRCAAESATRIEAPATELERQFQSRPVIRQAEKKLRIVVAGPGDVNRINALLKELKLPQPPTVVLFQAGEALVPSLAQRLGAPGWKPAQVLAAAKEPVLEAGRIYAGDFATDFPQLRREHGARRSSILVFGGVPSQTLHVLRNWPESQVIVEELQATLHAAKKELDNTPGQIVPVTSFSYLSDSWLSRSDEEERS